MLRNLFINFSVHHCELRELTNESKRINAEVTKHVCVLITQRMLKHKGYISFYHLCLTMNKRSVKKSATEHFKIECSDISFEKLSILQEICK